MDGSGPGGWDGVWWPQGRDLGTELADLADHYPIEDGRIVRALFSPPDWDAPVRRIPVRRGIVKVGSFPRDDTHLMRLTLSDRRRLVLLVVPSSFTDDQAETAFAAARAAAPMTSARDLLEAATDGAPA
jgi:hypothetical protein